MPNLRRLATSRKLKDEWQPVSTAPFDRDLELSVVNYDGAHGLAFPCRRILNGWIKVETKERVHLQPTHWREWRDKP